MDIDDETVQKFLKEVMDVESRPSFESGSQRSARKAEILKLLEKFCSDPEQ